MKKIRVYGRLRKFVGQSEFEVDVASPLEATLHNHVRKCSYLRRFNKLTN